MTNKKVTIRALLNKYKFAPFFSVPHQNAKTGVFYTGMSTLPKEYHDSKFKIKPEDTIPVIHSMTLDLNIEEHMCKYHYFLELGEIANRLSEAVPGKHIFFIEDIEQEAALSVSKDEKMIQAFELLSSNMSAEKLNNIAYFLSKDPRGVTENVLKKMIYTEAKNNPGNIIRAMDPKGKHQIFVSKLFFNQIVVKKKGLYFYGDVLLGVNLEEAVLFTLSPKNREVVNVLGQQLAMKEGKPLEDEGKMSLTMPDGEEVEVDEEDADKLLSKYSLVAPAMYRLKGKVGILQKNFNTIMKK